MMFRMMVVPDGDRALNAAELVEMHTLRCPFDVVVLDVPSSWHFREWQALWSLAKQYPSRLAVAFPRVGCYAKPAFGTAAAFRYMFGRPAFALSIPTDSEASLQQTITDGIPSAGLTSDVTVKHTRRVVSSLPQIGVLFLTEFVATLDRVVPTEAKSTELHVRVGEDTFFDEPELVPGWMTPNLYRQIATQAGSAPGAADAVERARAVVKATIDAHPDTGWSATHDAAAELAQVATLNRARHLGDDP